MGRIICPTQAEVGPERSAFGILLSLDDNPDDPAPRARRINDKVQTTAIPMPTGTEILDKILGQLSRKCQRQYHNSYHSTEQYRRNRNKSRVKMTASK